VQSRKGVAVPALVEALDEVVKDLYELGDVIRVDEDVVHSGP
jgi:hypothetical protein